jgi:hypothetical protein
MTIGVRRSKPGPSAPHQAIEVSSRSSSPPLPSPRSPAPTRARPRDGPPASHRRPYRPARRPAMQQPDSAPPTDSAPGTSGSTSPTTASARACAADTGLVTSWQYATRCPTSRSPPDLVADRLQHLGSLIQPIGRDEDEVAVVARNHPDRHATGRQGATIALSIPVACTSCASSPFHSADYASSPVPSRPLVPGWVG